ncbi:hypothetical protein JXO59_13465 [candidate division KSB1 bacterium]|nr:hypothetical protein [candidate division KSB1 bacterium]
MKDLAPVSTLERNTSAAVSQKLLRRRKLTVAAVVAATFLFLLFYNLGSYFFIKRMGRHLEGMLDQRLQVLGSLTAQIIERSLLDLDNHADKSLLQLTLNRIRLDHQLEAVYLIDHRRDVIVDARLDWQDIMVRSYLREDSTSIDRALSGLVSVSQLHTIADNHFKSVYTPLIDLSGSDYILVMEANADFLQVMAIFNRGLYAGVLTSVILLALLTIFLMTATSLFLRTEARLHQARRLAYLGQMSATVAHEIRNPLAVIKSTTDVLREKYSGQAKVSDLFTYIDDEIRRLNQLVNDFLSFSKEPSLKIEPTDLSRLIRQVLDTFADQPVTITFEAEENAFIVPCDADKIRQVLINLLLNAVQATDSQQSRIVVRLSEAHLRRKPFACVSVCDHGPGLMGKGNEIFEPFFTTKSSGTGLGLAVSRQLVYSHGGIIEAIEPEDGGTILRFCLPC